jgi:hypothetical protein
MLVSFKIATKVRIRTLASEINHVPIKRSICAGDAVGWIQVTWSAESKPISQMKQCRRIESSDVRCWFLNPRFARAEIHQPVTRRTKTNIDDEVSEVDETTIRNATLYSAPEVAGHSPY